MTPLGQAQRTLSRATHFLAGAFRAPAAGPYRARVLGNGLRELDRFLNLLVDEVARELAPPGFDHPAFARRRNTARKLRLVLARMERPSPHEARLRAIGRSRDCLFHCGGIVRRGREKSLAAAWPNAVPVAGRALSVRPADLASVCRFYDVLAADLLAALAAHGRGHCFLEPTALYRRG